MEELQKEIRNLKRKLELAEATLARSQRVIAAQNRVETILNKSLKKEQQFFNLVLENTTNILLLLDFDGRFAYASNTFLKAIDIANFGLIGGSHFEDVLKLHISAENLAGLSAAVDNAIIQKSTVSIEERIDFNFKGMPLTFLVYVTPMTDEDGKNTGIMVLFNDITEINNALEAANRANLAKSDFLANMSHEIRTPMNAIIGMTSIGKSATDIERMVYCFSRIESASKHLLGIINDILDMSKIEANKLELSPVEFDFEDMLRRVINVLSFRIDEKQQKFKVNIDSAIPKILIGDDQLLAQVITNLLGNAIKFTPDGGSISIDTSFMGEEKNVSTVRIAITDTGIGISEEQQSRLFNSFQQAESGTTRKFGGTGLGLVISKSIIEMMGGTIWIDSELEKGSTFSFSFQAKRGVSAQKQQPKIEPEPEKTFINYSRCRILLTEDVEINREIVLAMLEPTKIDIDCAKNGKEAVQMFQEAPDKYDMIFMDLQMPQMDGYEATRQIRALNIPKAKTIPIVAMTANVFREDIEQCLEAGMNEHIGKPLNSDEVLRQLHKYLR